MLAVYRTVHGMEISTAAAPVTRCLRCGRTLRSAASIKASYGAWCRAKIRAAAAAEAVKGFTEAQIAAARELIADGAAVALRHAGAYRVVSADGSAVYTTAAEGCNCPWGLRRMLAKACKHQLAVRILVAAKAA